MKCQKELFQLSDSVTYLNCGFMSPLMKSVEEAGHSGLIQKRHPYQVKVEDFFKPANQLRGSFSKLINCPDPDRVVIIPSVSYGISNVINNIELNQGENIIVTGEQFPSNVYPWQRLANQSGARLKSIDPPSDLSDRGKIWNQRILESIDPKTRIVALGHVHWADGTLFDLLKIRERSNEVGALLIIDGTQSVGAYPFDIRSIQPDALICAGYKWLMGPYSIGVAYYGEIFDNGMPVEENWINRLHSEDFQNLVNYQNEYQPGAMRYEIGEHSNFILVPMLHAAIQQIHEWGTTNIQDYCKDLISDHIAEIENLGYWVELPEYRGHHLFGIRLPSSVEPDQIKARLQDRNIFVSFRGDAIRVSVHVFNDKQDLEKLVDALKI